MIMTYNNLRRQGHMEYEQQFDFKVLSNPLGINLEDESKIWKKSTQSYPSQGSANNNTVSHTFKTPYFKPQQAPKNVHYSLMLSALEQNQLSFIMLALIFCELLVMGIYLHYNHFSWSTIIQKNNFVAVTSCIFLHWGIFYTIFKRLTKKFQFKIPE